MCPPGYYHNGFVATDALGHMMWDLSTLCVVDHLTTYEHLYFAPSLACWALFGSLPPAMCV